MKSFNLFLRDLFYSLYLRYSGQLKTSKDIAIAKMNGDCIDADVRATAYSQRKCNHRKGGTIFVSKDKDGKVSYDVVKCLDEGTDPQYSVMKHKMMNGDWRVRCTRCGKTWTAPIRQECRDERDFWKQIEEYEEAVNFPTNNLSSTSLQFQWRYRDGSDGSEVPRKAMAARV